LEQAGRKEEGQPDDNYGSARYTSCTVLYCAEINGSDSAVSAIERKTVAALPLSRRMPICYLSLPLDRIASEFANCLPVKGVLDKFALDADPMPMEKESASGPPTGSLIRKLHPCRKPASGKG